MLRQESDLLCSNQSSKLFKEVISFEVHQTGGYTVDRKAYVATFVQKIKAREPFLREEGKEPVLLKILQHQLL